MGRRKWSEADPEGLSLPAVGLQAEIDLRSVQRTACRRQAITEEERMGVSACQHVGVDAITNEYYADTPIRLYAYHIDLFGKEVFGGLDELVMGIFLNKAPQRFPGFRFLPACWRATPFL